MLRRAMTVIVWTALMVGAASADNLAYVATVTYQFGTIDLDTGVFTQLGSTGMLLQGLGVADGGIYGAAYGGSLYRLSPNNGALKLVGNTGLTIVALGSTPTGLYTIDVNNNLYWVNPATAAAKLIGPTGVTLTCNQVCGMSTNAVNLYLTIGSNLYTVSTTTGAATLVGSTGEGIGAMVSEGCKLYAGAIIPFQTDTLNTFTGTATFAANPSGNPPPTAFWGLAPSVLLATAPLQLTFPSQRVGTSSAPQSVTLTNGGFTAMTFNSMHVAGDFSETTTCGATLAPNTSCTVSVTFTPTQKGTRTGALEIGDTAGGGLQKIPLGGTGE